MFVDKIWRISAKLWEVSGLGTFISCFFFADDIILLVNLHSNPHSQPYALNKKKIF